MNMDLMHHAVKVTVMKRTWLRSTVMMPDANLSKGITKDQLVAELDK